MGVLQSVALAWASGLRLYTAPTVAAGLLGGTLTAGTHFAMAGGRAVINTSPEPVSNWGASFTEDAPIPRVWRGIRAGFGRSPPRLPAAGA